MRLAALAVLSVLAFTVGCAAEARGSFADGQRVEVSGTVRNFDGITAASGANYVVFFLNNAGGSLVVLAPGRPDFYEGEQIVVHGTFRQTLPVPFSRGSWRGAFSAGGNDHQFHRVVVADAGT